MGWLTGLVGLDLYLDHRGRKKAKKRYKKLQKQLQGQPQPKKPGSLSTAVSSFVGASRRGKIVRASLFGAFILAAVIVGVAGIGGAGHALTAQQVHSAQVTLQAHIAKSMRDAGASWASAVCPLKPPSQVGAHFTCTAADVFHGQAHGGLSVSVTTAGHGKWTYKGSLTN